MIYDDGGFTRRETADYGTFVCDSPKGEWCPECGEVHCRWDEEHGDEHDYDDNGYCRKCGNDGAA